MSEKPPSLRAHVLALLVLALLLAATVIVARVHLGALNAFAGLAIAALKAMVVLFFFMKLKASGAPVRFAAAFGFVWLAILIALTLGDFLTRMPVVVR
jgi:cytochrome c oxidase subunit 4